MLASLFLPALTTWHCVSLCSCANLGGGGGNTHLEKHSGGVASDTANPHTSSPRCAWPCSARLRHSLSSFSTHSPLLLSSFSSLSPRLCLLFWKGWGVFFLDRRQTDRRREADYKEESKIQHGRREKDIVLTKITFDHFIYFNFIKYTNLWKTINSLVNSWIDYDHTYVAFHAYGHIFHSWCSCVHMGSAQLT